MQTNIYIIKHEIQKFHRECTRLPQWNDLHSGGFKQKGITHIFAEFTFI